MVLQLPNTFTLHLSPHYAMQQRTLVTQNYTATQVDAHLTACTHFPQHSNTSPYGSNMRTLYINSKLLPYTVYTSFIERYTAAKSSILAALGAIFIIKTNCTTFQFDYWIIPTQLLISSTFDPFLPFGASISTTSAENKCLHVIVQAPQLRCPAFWAANNHSLEWVLLKKL